MMILLRIRVSRTLECIFSVALLLLSISAKPTDGFMPPFSLAGPSGFDLGSSKLLKSSLQRNSKSMLSPTLLTSTVRAADDERTAAFDMEYYDPNQIHPVTMSLNESIFFFCKFCVQMMKKNGRKKRIHKSIKKQYKQLLKAKKEKHNRRWKRSFAKLNEQRKNLVTLADYSAKIVAPSFIFLTLGALMSSLIPKYYAKCITLVATLDPDATKVTSALLGLAASCTLGAFFTGARGSLFWIAGTRANYNIRVKLHRNLLLQEAGFFDSNEVGYLLSRINNDVNKIGQVISYHVNVVTRQFAQFLFGSIYLFKISPALAGWAYAGIALVAWVSAVYGAFNRDLAQKVQDTFADATAVAETSLSMSETVRAFNGVQVESDKFETAQAKALELEEVQAWGYGTHKFISDTMQAFMQGGLLLACWHMGRAGGLPAGDLTTFIFYTNFVLESSNEVGDQWAKIQGAVGASSSVFDLIRRIPQVRDPPKELQPAPEDFSMLENVETSLESSTVAVESGSEPSIGIPGGEYSRTNSALAKRDMPLVNGKEESLVPVIEMRDMTIKYGAMDNPAVDGANLKIEHGDRVAIVGRSGSGKSSMLRSILRFYDPSQGSVSFKGIPLTAMSRQELTSKITVVEQEPHLFPMSLLENVLYGIDKDTTTKSGQSIYSNHWREKAAVALRSSGIPIHPGNDLNLCLDTRVGEGGRSLSGGQRQRVAIARALVRKPEILCLDEPTSALDSQSEKTVVEALKLACHECESMVMVTHRLGIISDLNVNRVLVMEKGKIVESGHPSDLLERPSGIFASLAAEQGIRSPHAKAEPTPM